MFIMILFDVHVLLEFKETSTGKMNDWSCFNKYAIKLNSHHHWRMICINIVNVLYLTDQWFWQYSHAATLLWWRICVQTVVLI